MKRKRESQGKALRKRVETEDTAGAKLQSRIEPRVQPQQGEQSQHSVGFPWESHGNQGYSQHERPKVV